MKYIRHCPYCGLNEYIEYDPYLLYDNNVCSGCKACLGVELITLEVDRGYKKEADRARSPYLL